MGQPRRNEKRFYRYPLHRIVAILDDAPSLGFALADMGAAGYETDALGMPTAALLDGRHVVYVPVHGDRERQRTIDILRARGGHHLLHFRRSTIEEIR